MRRKARRLALVEAPILFFSIVLCWQNVKICECLLGMPSFQMHRGWQCATPNGLPDAGPGGAPKGASPGLGGGADSLFSVVLCCQNFKICECLLAMPNFQCIGGGSVPPPMPCRTLGWAAHRKAGRLASAEAPNLFSLSYCVGKTLKCVNVCLQRPVFSASRVAVCRPQSVARR